MEIRDALKGQYHAAFRMLTDVIELCPDSLWSGVGQPREYWQIAYHAAFFGHLYLMQKESDFQPFAKHHDFACDLWGEEQEKCEPLSKDDVLEYIVSIREMVGPTIDALDLDTSDSGFHWYKEITKLEHEILSIRHLQGHVGQLSERLMEAGIDSKWISRRE